MNKQCKEMNTKMNFNVKSVLQKILLNSKEEKAIIHRRSII